MKIILSTRGEKILTESILNEISDFSKEGSVISYLDSHYVRADIDKPNEFGELTKQPMVVALDSRKQPSEITLTLDQLFERLQFKFQKIIGDTSERDAFLHQVIDDWYYKRVSKNGSLTKY